ARPSSCWLNTIFPAIVGKGGTCCFTSFNALRICASIFSRVDLFSIITVTDFPLLTKVLFWKYGKCAVFSPNTFHYHSKQSVFCISTTRIHQLSAEHDLLPNPESSFFRSLIVVFFNR